MVERHKKQQLLENIVDQMEKPHQSDNDAEQKQQGNISHQNTANRTYSMDFRMWQENPDLVGTTHHARLTTNPYPHQTPTDRQPDIQEKTRTGRQNTGKRKIDQHAPPRPGRGKKRTENKDNYIASATWKPKTRIDEEGKNDYNSEEIEDIEIGVGVEVMTVNAMSYGKTTSTQYRYQNSDDRELYQNVKWQSRKEIMPEKISSIRRSASLSQKKRASPCTKSLDLSTQGQIYEDKTSSIKDLIATSDINDDNDEHESDLDNPRTENHDHHEVYETDTEDDDNTEED